MNIKNKIKITVNGKQMQIIPKFTLKSLITKLKMPLNKVPYWLEGVEIVTEGIEVVHFIGGG